MAVASSAPDSYEQVTSRVADLMVGLDRDVARLRSEAEADAAKIPRRSTDRGSAYPG